MTVCRLSRLFIWSLAFFLMMPMLSIDYTYVIFYIYILCMTVWPSCIWSLNFLLLCEPKCWLYKIWRWYGLPVIYNIQVMLTLSWFACNWMATSYHTEGVIICVIYVCVFILNFIMIIVTCYYCRMFSDRLFNVIFTLLWILLIVLEKF